MAETTMKFVERFPGDVAPDAIERTLNKTADKMYSAFGQAGTIRTLKLEPAAAGGHVLIVIVEVNE